MLANDGASRVMQKMLLRPRVAYVNIVATRRAGELQRKEEKPQSSEVNPNAH